MYNDTDFRRAEKLKGYGSYRKNTPDSEVQRIKTLPNKFRSQDSDADPVLKVQPKIIRSVSEYMDFIVKLETSYANPVFYRGHPNADYLLIPSSLRKETENEHIVIEQFSRKFYSEISKCRLSIEKLIFMQHYLLPTRCLDISENPLVSLYFACSVMKKFRKEKNPPETEQWGEVLIFREPKEKEKKDARPEKLKEIESSNISIIASTAFMEEDFSLWHLGARWKKDVDIGHNEIYMDLRSIVRRSYIVRLPKNNERVKNQQGAFIMANANMAYIEEEEYNIRDLTELILKKNRMTYDDLIKENIAKSLNKEETWYLHFKKVKPYDESNEIEEFRTDPFDIRRLYYKDENKVQQVVLIPPEKKKDILRELERLNITEEFVYPEMDTVANEIREKFMDKN